MSDLLERVASLVGRALLSSIFLMSGLGKIMDWSGTSQHMADKGMVLVPLFLAGAVALELGGGLSLLLGFQARWGALALILFLIPVTLVMHNFWQEQEPAALQNQMIHFMKNVAILGGLFVVAAFGSGPLSLDAGLRTSTARRAAESKAP